MFVSVDKAEFNYISTVKYFFFFKWTFKKHKAKIIYTEQNHQFYRLIIFRCYFLQIWISYKRTLYCFLNDSVEKVSPWLLVYSVNLCIRSERCTTADEASPRVQPARSQNTGGAENSTVYKTLLHWHSLAHERTSSQSERTLTFTPPAHSSQT